MAKTTKLAQPKHTHTTVHVRTGISRTTTFTIPMPPRGTIFLFRYQMGEVNLLTTSSTCVHVGARVWWATWEVHVSAPLDCPIVFDRRLRDLCTVLMHRLLSQGSFLFVWQAKDQRILGVCLNFSFSLFFPLIFFPLF